jgi:hypothetical protein
MRQQGLKMRLDMAETRSYQSDVRKTKNDDSRKSLLTPARREALDALEREFRELLDSLPR